jgi:AcrR family transcriptional regulator
LARAQITDLQRARIIAAVSVSCSERGVANVTVAHIVERSGVSRRTFYELFADRDDCFLAAFEQALEHTSERVRRAYASAKSWQEKIRAGLIALLGILDEEPAIGRLLIVESLGGGPVVLQRRGEAMAKLTRAIERGRKDVKGKGRLEPPPMIGEGLVGGALSVIYTRMVDGAGDDHAPPRAGKDQAPLRAGDDHAPPRAGKDQAPLRAGDDHAPPRAGKDQAPLIELANPLMSMLVLPYLGAAAARRELERPLPDPVAEQRGAVLSDPFRETGLRMTYRTVRVLAAIADLSGQGVNPSNRLIADFAEIRDQGQISKLLRRLERGGLVVNQAASQGRGAPNSWALSDSGQRAIAAIRVHTKAAGQEAAVDETYPQILAPAGRTS